MSRMEKIEGREKEALEGIVLVESFQAGKRLDSNLGMYFPVASAVIV